MASTSASASAGAPPSPIAVIGAGGNMATSIITGLLAHPQPPTIVAAGPRLASMQHLQLPPSQKTTSNTDAIADANLVLLCVKPNLIASVLKELSPALHARSIPLISVAAGVTTAAMEEALQTGASPSPPVLRAMPNLPASEGAAVTALCRGSTASDPHAAAATAALAAIGDVELIPESLFAAATSVAGCGVAYVFLMAEALADAGVAAGLPRQVAMRMAAGTVLGAGKVLATGEHPAILRNRVESPGGVTVAATAALEREGFRPAVIAAARAAFDRVREMGEK